MALVLCGAKENPLFSQGLIRSILLRPKKELPVHTCFQEHFEPVVNGEA